MKCSGLLFSLYLGHVYFFGSLSLTAVQVEGSVDTLEGSASGIEKTCQGETCGNGELSSHSHTHDSVQNTDSIIAADGQQKTFPGGELLTPTPNEDSIKQHPIEDETSSDAFGHEQDTNKEEVNTRFTEVKESPLSSSNEDGNGQAEEEKASLAGPGNGLDKDETSNENDKEEEDLPTPKRRFFPLLYTFRTLLNSLISEFGGDDNGNQEPSFNASKSEYGNLTVTEELIKDLNTTSNGTDTGRKTRFQCAMKNMTLNSTGMVKIVNSTELLEILNFSKNQKMSTCVLVMFYAPWCHFCARTAPHYNALARAFPQLDVLAVDTSHFSYLNARFGTVAVPNVMLFYSRSAVRFNHTARALETFIDFVRNNTGLEPNRYVKLEPTDFVGPLPSIVVRGRDWLLWLAWTFVILCSVYGFVRSQVGQGFIARLRVLWQEHQHIE